jgi:hypothetical protein
MHKLTLLYGISPGTQGVGDELFVLFVFAGAAGSEDVPVLHDDIKTQVKINKANPKRYFLCISLTPLYK